MTSLEVPKRGTEDQKHRTIGADGSQTRAGTEQGKAQDQRNKRCCRLSFSHSLFGAPHQAGRNRNLKPLAGLFFACLFGGHPQWTSGIPPGFLLRIISLSRIRGPYAVLRMKSGLARCKAHTFPSTLSLSPSCWSQLHEGGGSQCLANQMSSRGQQRSVPPVLRYLLYLLYLSL